MFCYDSRDPRPGQSQLGNPVRLDSQDLTIDGPMLSPEPVMRPESGPVDSQEDQYPQQTYTDSLYPAGHQGATGQTRSSGGACQKTRPKEYGFK